MTTSGVGVWLCNLSKTESVEKQKYIWCARESLSRRSPAQHRVQFVKDIWERKTTDEGDQAVLIAMLHICRKRMQHQQNTAEVWREQKGTEEKICRGSTNDSGRLLKEGRNQIRRLGSRETTCLHSLGEVLAFVLEDHLAPERKKFAKYQCHHGGLCVVFNQIQTKLQFPSSLLKPMPVGLIIGQFQHERWFLPCCTAACFSSWMRDLWPGWWLNTKASCCQVLGSMWKDFRSS